MQVCEIFTSTEDDWEPVGTIELKDGKIIGTPKPDSYGEVIFPAILGSDNYMPDGTVVSWDDPEAWFKALPKALNTTFLYAEMSEEHKDDHVSE
jgi:hypothetical protein